MKVVECCPFFNENLVAEIKIAEARTWVDELHITECNKSFRFGDKPYSFRFADDPLVHYRQLDGNTAFIKPDWVLSCSPWFIKKQNHAWENDGIQRNIACSYIDVDDRDIVILSDLDEIIDSRYADRIIHETQKRGIVTIKLHFTLFYFNLFSKNWGGPPSYSYRTFIMTGRYFKSMFITSDRLRKKGEHGKLFSTVHCLEDTVGFHHSWLGDDRYVAEKLKSYAHDAGDHDSRVFSADGSVNMDYVRECIEQKRSVFGPEHELYVNNDINLLESVEKCKLNSNSKYFI